MTVRMMIKQLMDYPMDWQVVDTEGSPIMYSVTKYDNKVYLEPKSQMDINNELYELIETAMEIAQSDIDTLEDLIERGYTLEDLKEYSESTYEWAKNLAEEYEIDF